MGFTNVQGQPGSIVLSGSTASVTLSAPPTQGNLVVVGIIYSTASPVPSLGATVADGSGNPYILSPSSPQDSTSTSTGVVWMGYLLPAPANASATITVTFNTTITDSAVISAQEFSFTGGMAGFDTDIAGTGTGTAINSPAIAARYGATGALLVSYTAVEHNITSANSPWTQGLGGTVDGEGTTIEYILSSSSGPTAVNYTQSPSGQWNAIALAFSLNPIYMIAN